MVSIRIIMRRCMGIGDYISLLHNINIQYELGKPDIIGGN